MELEELIKIITDEVIKKLKDNTKKDKRKKILVLEPLDSNEYCQLVEEYNKDPYEFYPLDSTDKNVESYDFVLVPKLDNRELVNLSLGIPCGIREKVIIDCILKDKKVYIFGEGLEYRKYSKTSNKIFYKMYQEYENRIVNFGLKIINNFSGLFQNEEINEEVDEKTEIESEEHRAYDKENKVEVTKKVLTETDIDKLYKSGAKEIIINNKTILTPLAKDYIRIKSIAVKRV